MKAAIERGLALLMCVGLPLLGVAKPPVSPMRAKEVSIPLYSPGQPEPTAVIRIKRIYKDHQRRGFFRIGVLPLWVAEEVHVQLLSYQNSDQLLNQLTRALTSQHSGLSQSLEIRSLQLRLPDSAEPRLEAGRVRIAEDGSWRLLDSVTWRTDSQTIHCNQASLSASQDSSGSPCLQLNLPQGSRAFRLLEIPTHTRPHPSPLR